ncbi:unnamed protein product [Bursaphelenchus okinawaensis]|uniref:Tubulin-specific chaperone A n=1 Tax=Bursaphelenchus okinawaensis TaxID=465554 RepID=A0A811JQW8_9BILA|nr:unnamed protein product [Bursaphelenchus okinawaensis]CAG9078656.1 unnamed protein product [Bursaphelenchus okinawaensis]
MTDAKVVKQLTIKTNVLKRLIKEVDYYVKEGEKQKASYTELEAKDPSAYELKKLDEVWKETISMIPTIERKVRTARDDLKNYITANENEIKETGELQLANEQLERATAF